MKYVLLWSTRRKAKVLTHEVRRFLERLIADICRRHSWTLKDLRIGLDWVALEVEADPSWAPRQIAYRIKRETAGRLKEKFPETFLRLPSVWTRETLFLPQMPERREAAQRCGLFP